MKRFITLLLCLVMCVSMFVACGGNDPATDDTTKTPDTTQEANGTDPVVTTDPVGTDDTDEPDETTKGFGYEDVEKKNWDGYTFKIHYNTLDNMQTDFVCENPNGNVLNDQIYQRNQMVETDLSIDIDVTPESGGGTKLNTQVLAGWTEGDYNMFAYNGRLVFTDTKNGNMADLGSYEQINIYRDYWDQNFIEMAMIDDSIYAMPGELNTYTQTAVQVICFNKNLFQQNGLDTPYNAVKNYEWTIDMLLEYMDGFAIDYDNNGYEWDKDRFALSGWGSESSYGIFYGTGFTFAKNDGETIVMDVDQDLLDEVVDLTLNVWCKNGSYINMSSQTAQHHMPHEIFSTGRGLFCDISCVKIGVFFTEMDDDYGIVPEPMYTADQGRYYSFVASNAPIICVPKTDPNSERTGNILEAICAASHDVVKPKMLEIVTKIQHARDEESADMLDIAINSKIYDAVHWLQLSGIYSLPRSLISEGDNVSGSYMTMFGDKAEGELETYVEIIAELKTRN